MVSRKILKSHPVSVLKKEISKTNIKGYSKMKKPELIDLMMKPEHADRFAHIEIAPSRAEKKAQKEKNAKSQKEGDDFLKREEERMKKEEEAKKKELQSILAKSPPKKKGKEVKKAKKVTSFTVTKADGSKKEVKTGRVKRRAEEKKAKEKKPKKLSAEDESKKLLKSMLKEQRAELAKLKKNKASKELIKQKTLISDTIKAGIKAGFID